jgi:hypothetical protein
MTSRRKFEGRDSGDGVTAVSISGFEVLIKVFPRRRVGL